MLSLAQVKSAIYKTICAKYMQEGLYCSEPIITTDHRGLIDNYFIYGASDDESSITTPLFSFGIYSDILEVAYHRNTSNTAKTIENSHEDVIDVQGLIARYEQLYGSIRSFVYTDCDEQQRQELRMYIDALKHISGDAIWKLYKKMSPMFFEWVDKILQDT